eukprot:354169-Chlamydomonas_euryale.AAC.22
MMSFAAMAQGFSWDHFWSLFITVAPIWLLGAITGYLVSRSARQCCRLCLELVASAPRSRCTTAAATATAVEAAAAPVAIPSVSPHDCPPVLCPAAASAQIYACATRFLPATVCLLSGAPRQRRAVRAAAPRCRLREREGRVDWVEVGKRLLLTEQAAQGKFAVLGHAAAQAGGV